MDFTDGPLATIANLPRLHSGCVGPCGCWGEGDRTGLGEPLPSSTPGRRRGAEAGTQSVALVSAGGMENKKDEVTAKRSCRM